MATGERIGNFEILDILSEDAFAIAYRGRDLFSHRPALIRICIAADESVRRRFLAASQEMAALHHPNIVQVLGFGSGESKPYLVQELFEDRELPQLFLASEPVNHVVKLFYLAQIARGLQYAHGHGVLHRDLRPGVIHVLEGERIKIADFGISRLAGSWRVATQPDPDPRLAGTLAPEQILGLETDGRADVFGFGALAYELLTGRPPFVGKTLQERLHRVLTSEPTPLELIWPDCPPALALIVERCLRKDAGQRFEDAEDLVAELREVIPMPLEPAGSPSSGEEEELEVETLYALTPSSLEGSAGSPEGEPPRPPGLGWLRDEVLRGVGRTARLLEVVPGRLAAGRSWLAAHRRAAVGMAAGALLAVLAVAMWGALRRPPAAPPAEAAKVTVEARPEMPVAIPEGRLVIDARPWAEIVRLQRDGAELPLPDEPFTPLVLTLPPGLYEIHLDHPDGREPRVCRVQVLSRATASCSEILAEPDLVSFFRESGWWR